jgi:hypothetical protein
VRDGIGERSGASRLAQSRSGHSRRAPGQWAEHTHAYSVGAVEVHVALVMHVHACACMFIHGACSHVSCMCMHVHACAGMFMHAPLIAVVVVLCSVCVRTRSCVWAWSVRAVCPRTLPTSSVRTGPSKQSHTTTRVTPPPLCAPAADGAFLCGSAGASRTPASPVHNNTCGPQRATPSVSSGQ